ncbi:MAG: IS110 family transposase [Myxococcota bacterium]
MRYAGIDVASEKHFIAVVDDDGGIVEESTSFTEDVDGYAKLFRVLGAAEDVALVALEATGHYWKNLVAALMANGFKVALLNPSRTSRFAAEEMQRTKTDAIDAMGIARFAAQKKPVVSRLPDSVTDELRELVRLRNRLMQDLGDRVRELHRVVDLGFPEFTRYVRTLDSELATGILKDYPTAEAFLGVPRKTLSNFKYDGRHFVGLQLADQLIAAAKTSVGRHHGHAYRVQVKYFCQDIDVFRARLKELDRDIESRLDKHEVGKLLTTIDGIGSGTAARLIAVLGDPSDFRDERALAAYVGVVPALRQSGKRQPTRAAATTIGNAALRTALYMPTLTAVRKNAWLKRFYECLVAAGKPKKLALIAAMRKLLHAIYSVAKHRRAFVPKLEATT